MPKIAKIHGARSDVNRRACKAEKRCPFAIFAPYLNLRLVAIKHGAKTMNRWRQQLSLAVCDAPPPPLHADRGPHAFFSSCVCSSSNCGLAYAAAASTCTWQRREKYVVARAVALWQEWSGATAFCRNRQQCDLVSCFEARSAVNGRFFVFVRDAF